MMRKLQINVYVTIVCLLIPNLGQALASPYGGDSLFALASQTFGESSLTWCEKLLLRSIPEGEVADCRDKTVINNNPEKGMNWSDNRKVRAKFIHWLCFNIQARDVIPSSGIYLFGAQIIDWIDLGHARLSFPLVIKYSYIPKGIYLRSAHIAELVLSGSYIGPINAPGMRIDGSVLLDDKFYSNSMIHLSGSTIGGNLDLRNSTLNNPKGTTLSCDSINVKGDVILSQEFVSNGQIIFYDAVIGGNLSASHAKFNNFPETSFAGDRINVHSNIFFDKEFESNGAIHLLGATIGNNLEFSNGIFLNSTNSTIRADNTRVGGNVFLNGKFKSEGLVSFLGSRIGGMLCCTDGTFINKNNTTIICDGAIISDDVRFNDEFLSNGQVSLIGTSVGSQLNCKHGRFINPQKVAIRADNIHIKGSTYFSNGMEVLGSTRIPNATIEGNAYFDSSKFTQGKDDIILAESATIKGNLHFRSVKVSGSVNMNSASINQFLNINDVETADDDNYHLDLSNATLGVLNDELSGWPKSGNLTLHGLTYNAFASYCTLSLSDRLEWLKRQEVGNSYLKNTSFSPQPYEHLANIFRKHGYESEAEDIEIAKNDALLNSGKLSGWDLFWHRAIGTTIAYGYKPWRTVWISIIIIVIGSIIFGLSYNNELMTPSKMSDFQNGTYPTFNAVMYSFDMFVPIVNFYFREYWLPNARSGKVLFSKLKITIRTGDIVRYYFWFHIAMGWICSTLFVLSFSGLVKK